METMLTWRIGKNSASRSRLSVLEPLALNLTACVILRKLLDLWSSISVSVKEVVVVMTITVLSHRLL
jgi:hypothetical protein